MNQEILNRYLTGDASAEEKQMVVRWLDTDPQHMREYLALRKLHDHHPLARETGSNG